jgi:Na+-transporting methylmalonyl-CoA/oxaloacetate decarboxylase gamma subunit
MKGLGIVLIVLGILGFVFGGIAFTRKETVADIGPIEIQATEKECIPIAPIASGAAVVAGLVLVLAGARKRA